MLSRFLNKALTLLDLGDKLSFVGIKKFTSQTPLGDQYYPWVLYAAPLFAFLSIPVIIKSDIESIPVEGSIVNKLQLDDNFLALLHSGLLTSIPPMSVKLLVYSSISSSILNPLCSSSTPKPFAGCATILHRLRSKDDDDQLQNLMLPVCQVANPGTRSSHSPPPPPWVFSWESAVSPIANKCF